LQEELRKIKLPTFDGENKMGEDAKAWLLGIRKYFQLIIIHLLMIAAK
jgi:hypothetical protein